MIPTPTFVIDDRRVDVSGWSCNTVLNRGFDNFRGVIRERDAYRIGQGSKLTAYIDANHVLWEGRLALDPFVSDGTASIAASGPRARVEKAGGRLLYQTRDTGLLRDEGIAPHSYVTAQEVSVQVAPGIVSATVSADTTLPTGTHGVLVWIPGGTVSRVALNTEANGLGWHLVILEGTGPNGTLASVIDTSVPAGVSSIEQILSGNNNQLVLRFYKTSGAGATGDARCDLTDIRINGIALGDEFSASEVVKNVGSQVGFDTSGVRGFALNVLPLDHQQPWVNLLDYITVLTDWHWGAFEDRGAGPQMIFEPFEDEWTVTRAKDGRPRLSMLERYNRIVVTGTINGAPFEVEDWPDVDPLGGRDSNTWIEQLADDQTDLTLATSVAASLTEKFAAVRYQGPVELADAVDPHGRRNILGIRPGVVAKIADYGPMSALSLRVHEVEYRPDGVTLGIESPVSAAGLIARALLDRNRVPYRYGNAG